MSKVIVKICGLTNLVDARCALDAGASWLGFIFYARSARYLTPDQAKEIIGKLPAETESVGVFVNEDLDRVREIAAHAGLKRVQCHGSESAAYLRGLAPLRTVKALAFRTPADLERLGEFSSWPVLADTPTPEHGGSGLTGDWSLAAEAARRCRLILAGGLTPDNVAAAITQVVPWGVDVSSGVEQSKGRKDHGRVHAFVAAARAASVGGRG